SASLAGKLAPNLMFLAPKQTVTVLNAAGGVTDAGLAPVNTPYITYGLAFSPSSLAVTISQLNFTLPSLNANASGISNYLNTIWNSGELSGLQPTFTALVNVDPASLPGVLNRLSPESHVTNVTAGMMTGLAFA